MLHLHACMSVTALIWANPVASDYRLGIPQACKQAEISVVRLETMRCGAQTADAGCQSGLTPLFNSSIAQHKQPKIKHFTGKEHV